MLPRRENTSPRMQMLTILTRNYQLLNQKSKTMNSTRVISTLTHLNKSLRRCEGLNGSRLESTTVQERRHGQSVTHGTTIPSDSDLTLRTATGELVKGGKRMHVVAEFEVFKHRCANRCCLLESTRRRAVSLCCMVTKVTCFTKVRMLRRKSMRGSRRS